MTDTAPARICKDFSSQEEKPSYLLRRHLKHNIDSFVRIFMAQFWSQSAREWGRLLVLFSFLDAEILRHGPITSFSPTDFIDTVVLPLTRKWHTLLQPSAFFSISIAWKKGVRFIRRSTTKIAISWAVGGVGQQLFNPSPLFLPHAFIGYSRSALRRAPAELRQSQRGRIWEKNGQIAGCCQLWPLCLAPIAPLVRWLPTTTLQNVR
jgi:hypothetical protein